MRKTAWSLLLGWLTWVSTAIIDLKKDVAVLRHEVLGVVAINKTPSLEHPRPILSFPLLPGLDIPFEKPAPAALDKEKNNVRF